MIRRLVLASIAFVSTAAQAVDLNGVNGFEPDRFLGSWYQIESTNPFFQRGCLCAKANYTYIDQDTIEVENECFKPNGQKTSIRGKATIKDRERPSRLSVSFSPISFGGVNYVVTETGEGSDYGYAVIVSPGNSPIWILAREKTLPAEVLAGIKLRLVRAGVRISDLKETNPLRCEGF